LAAQTCVNLYTEYNEAGGEDGAFYGTPGLIQKAALNPGQGRALKTSGDGSVLYAVCGFNVYQIDPSWRTTLIGTLSTARGQVSAAANDTQVVFAHSGGFSYTTGTSLATVANAPGNGIITFMDGYGVFTERSDGQFGLTAINDFSSIDPIDVATAEALPDNLVAAHADQREVWLLGEESTEIWADTGAAAFPFERIPGGVISIGCAAPYSVTYTDGSLFWLSRDRTGKAFVVRTIGYQTDRVSSHAIEHLFDGFPFIEDAYAFGYSEEGHTFYVITFPSADQTYAYDCSTKQWARRGWQDTSGVLHRHRVGAYAFFNNEHCILDHHSGALYTMGLEATTDAGTPIYRERAWPLVSQQEMKRLRCDMLELVAEQGVGAVTGTDANPKTWLQMSFDGGVSFGNERYQMGGQIGQRLARMRWRRNGIGRRPVARVGTTSSQKVVWIAANVEGELLAV
jgi:hypothetical protein